ncbi:protein S40-1-like [Miscanthus floridulus]|uniref:protein S40-1-like n=1 Tax=Miscanthus floridulus TaxID=154761 RepID=UPI003459B7B6
MEEFEEAEILWPAAGSDDRANGGEEEPIPCSVRPEAAAPRPAATAPVEISRRKRRCRPWPASEYYTTTFDQETDAAADDEEGRRTDDAKGTTSDGLVIVPPHVLLARRRLVVGGRTAAYSMCAGKGRTLKGRDLRDVRNLVLKMTRFIEE